LAWRVERDEVRLNELDRKVKLHLTKRPLIEQDLRDYHHLPNLAHHPSPLLQHYEEAQLPLLQLTSATQETHNLTS
jgi:hypothetical protein